MRIRLHELTNMCLCVYFKQGWMTLGAVMTSRSHAPVVATRPVCFQTYHQHLQMTLTLVAHPRSFRHRHLQLGERQQPSSRVCQTPLPSWKACSKERYNIGHMEGGGGESGQFRPPPPPSEESSKLFHRFWCMTKSIIELVLKVAP